MLQEIRVIKAGLADFEKFYSLFKKSLLEKWFLYSENSSRFMLEVDYSKEFIEENLRKDYKKLYLIYVKNEVVGYLLTHRVYAGVAHANWLGVDPNFQKKGFASKLINIWSQEVLKDGGHKLELWTTKNNLEFYKKRGFVLGGEIPDSWFGIDHYLFYKTLRKSDEKNFLKSYLEKKS